MAELPYMPWYPSDYGADTKHLTLEEHGAYRLLLDELWMRGGAIRFDEKRLAKLLSVTPHRFRKIWTGIGEFFCLEGGEIRHKRISEELEKARKSVEKRAEIARQAAQKRWKKDKKNKGNAMPEALPEHCHPEPEGSGTPLKGDTKNLPHECALALDGLRASAATEHAKNEVNALASSVCGWEDKTIFVTGKYVLDRFTESLARELRAERITLAIGKPSPKLTAIEGGRS
ncbi:YdaU family protein [Henriciella aquimarina]|uniref:YdaU family protein n=1 Tax=Henriciella aquimarina TaxID=545261 RepID=UPI000A059205|nr:DUF1376 domain-containing protein [Henriciella aquimarina]